MVRGSRIVFAVIAFLLSAAIRVGPAYADADDSFPIAATSAREMALSVAFDGANYLVGIQGCDGCTNGRSDDITAQLVMPSGALLGGRITIGRAGGSPRVAFDGTNYLLVWPDAAVYGNDVLYGQFVSPSEGLVGLPFPIAELGGSHGFGGSVTYGGGEYLVTYAKQADDATVGIYAKTISQSGAVPVSETPVSERGDEIMSNAVFDGTRFLVYWVDGNGLVKGRLAPLFGDMTPEFPIATSAPDDYPLISVAWDGTHYLFVWAKPVAGGRELLGQRVGSSGNLVGAPTTIASASAVAFFPFLAFDGTNFLVTWTDARTDPDWSIYARFVDTSGAPVGPEFPVSTATGNQFGSPVVFGAGKYLVAWTSGEGFDGESGDVWGTFVPPVEPVPVDSAAPVTVASISPSPNASGWNDTDVSVTLTSTDDVQSITYVLTGAQTGGATVPGSSTSIPITAEGITAVTFSGTDYAGNVESPRTATINLDKTAPTITVSAASSILWPPNGKLVPDVFVGKVTEGLSSLDPSATTFRVVDEYGVIQPSDALTVMPDGSYSFTLRLQASRLDQDRDGRQYRVFVNAADKAGNAASVSTVVTVPHDRR